MTMDKIFISNENLTRREQEVLKLLSQGFTTKEISIRLHISETTVNTHRRNMLLKTDSKNTAELIFKTSRNLMI